MCFILSYCEDLTAFMLRLRRPRRGRRTETELKLPRGCNLESRHLQGHAIFMITVQSLKNVCKKISYIYIWSPQCVFEVRVGSKLDLHQSTFRTKIVLVWTCPSNSQHLNPSILSPIVYQMVLQGCDLNSSSTTI